MPLYLVAYQTKQDDTPIVDELKRSPKWWHYMDGVWVVQRREPKGQALKEQIGKEFDFSTGDRMFIVEISQTASRGGWLPPKAWEWFKKDDLTD